MASTHKNTLSPLGPHLHNRSMSSINSEAATFHSAQAGSATEIDHPNDSVTIPSNSLAEPSLAKLSRTDSGYEPGKERRSTSTSSSRSRRPRHSTSSTAARPTAKRASRSTPTTSVHRVSPRPASQSRYTTSHALDPQATPQQPYQFFQFPSLTPPAPPLTPSASSPQPQPHPPPTIHYFLLPETRRLEYAAIDAASRGVRGFITKLLPDCILPLEYRRLKFHNEDGHSNSDAGSVRRYRLHLPDPEEKPVAVDGRQGSGRPQRRIVGVGGDGQEEHREDRPKGKSLWQRVVGFGRR